MNGLDLFSGIGGISLALREWVKPIGYCEIDGYCQAVLLSRMYERSLRPAPIWGDIRTLNGKKFFGFLDIIYGGFPCQDISVAGHGKGLAGERSGLFFEIVRLAEEIKPKFIFLENVPAITSRGGITVARTITEMGYDCRWCVISAASVGALHRRERWFLLAHSKHDGASTSKERGSIREELVSWEFNEQAQDSGAFERTSCLSSDVAHAHGSGCGEQRWSGSVQEEFSTSECDSEDVANSEYKRCIQSEFQKRSRLEAWLPKGRRSLCNTDRIPGEQTNTSTESKQRERRTWRESSGQHWPFESREHWQEVVSGVCRVSDGIPFQVDRLRALGNSVCPQQVKEAFKILMGIN